MTRQEQEEAFVCKLSVPFSDNTGLIKRTDYLLQDHDHNFTRNFAMYYPNSDLFLRENGTI